MVASENDLRASLEQRFKGDRSGACIAAAIIENGTAAKAYHFSDAKSGRSIDDRTAFEIGSVTMVAALLADLIGQGEIADPEFEMAYDSAGEFYPFEFDAVLQPRRKADGTHTFTWYQLGGIQQAERVGTARSIAVRQAPAEAQLKEYEGHYSFSRTLGLRVYTSGPKLMIQSTGLTPLEAEPLEQDIFVAEPVGAEIAFERDANGSVIKLTVNQRGQILTGERH